ncbi:MAG: cation diffusion facilitator family transporter [Gammaproteobacteria bacterium]
MPAGSPSEERYRSMRRVTLVGAFTNVFLASAQLVGGWLTHSQALVADGAHTLSDLFSDFLVLFAARKANAAADARHPYGHGRIETLATVGVGLVLAGVGLAIMFDAGRRLLSPEQLLAPTPLALALAALAIVSKEILYHYTIRSARRLRSSMLEANAWHHRSDVASSIVVIAGVGATLAGLRFMDAVAAILVALLIGHMGLRMIWNSAHELIDTGVEPEEQERMLEALRALDGVRGAHGLRTRRMGGMLLADVHVLVAPRISVSEGHRISESACRALRKIDAELGDILVHVDPEDDQKSAPSSHLPGRLALLERLQPYWADIGVQVASEEVILHYLDGRVGLDLELPLSALDAPGQAAELSERIARASRQVEEIGEVRVRFRPQAEQRGHPPNRPTRSNW